MVRSSFCAAVALLFFAGVVLAADQNQSDKDKAKKGHEATITKVDRQNGTVTVRMKGEDGKEHERTFKLTEEVRYLDSTGRVAAADIFTSGDEVLVVEEQGHLKELHKHRKGDKGVEIHKGNQEKKDNNSGKKPSK